MSQYLYAIIPYKSGMDFTYNEEPFYWNPRVPEFDSIESELTDMESNQIYGDYLILNTCHRMSSLTCDTRGFCWIRSEIYKLAQAVGAKEVWYVEELCIDEIEEEGPSLDNFKQKLANELSYCTREVNLEMLRSDAYASYCHDDFSDIVEERHK